MKRKIKVSTIILLSLLLGCNQASSQTAEELLPKAIQLEEVKGELEQAIRVYQTIVEKYPGNRAIAAQAYIHMGRCYEKLGKQDAQKAYNMVLSDYADQEEMVKEAKARLAALTPQAGLSLKNEMTVRKVWDGPESDIMGEPSPDGKYISYVDWSTGDLAIYEVATGKKRRLTNTGSWDDPNEFAEFSSWSPDGKFLVYDWYNDDNPSCINLYIIGLDGSEPRQLWYNEEMEWAVVYDWSSDGKHILACLARKDNTAVIALISASDGSARILKEFKGEGQSVWPNEMKISPDGAYIAYDVRQEEGSSQRDIYLISSDGRVETPVVEHPSNDILLGWLPDGKSVFFGSDRNGAMGAWSIMVQNGIPQGEPSLLKPDIGPVHSLGLTQDGSYYYGIMHLPYNIDIIELDQETGQIKTHLKKAIRQFEGNNQTPGYSRDGKYLAYIRRFPVTPGLTVFQGGNVLCIKSLETGKEREFHPALNRFGYPSWSPDGSSVLVVNWDADGRMGYFNIDVQTGLVTKVMEAEENFSLFGGHQWSLDGKTIYYGLQDKKANEWQIISRDMESGDEKVIYQSKDFYQLSLSPDGQLLALCFVGWRGKAHVNTISISGEESNELVSFDKKTRLGRNNAVTWSADGKYILFAVDDRSSEKNMYELCRIPADGGDLEKLGLKGENGFENLSAHPNGRNFAYSTVGERTTEIWVLENFLPQTTSK